MSHEELVGSFLIDEFRKGNGIIFLGAGLSMCAGLPSWPQLVEPLADRIGCPKDNLIKIPQYYIQRYNSRLPLYRYLRDRIKTPDARPTESHRLIAQLPVRVIFTTNYDELMEDALREAFKPFHRVVLDRGIANWDESREIQLVKLHGSIDDEETIVITEDDYRTYFQKHSAMLRQITALLTIRTFLFVGYSFSDPDFNFLYDSVQNYLEREKGPHYAIMYNVNQFDTDYYRDRGLQIINITAAKEDYPTELEKTLEVLVRATKGGDQEEKEQALRKDVYILQSESKPESLGSTKRIAVLTEMVNIPSPPYHLEIIQGIVRTASHYNFSIALYEISRFRLDSDIRKILSSFHPDAVVMIRLTPNPSCLKSLKRAIIPVILVHSDRFMYPSPPVLANIVPFQKPIQEYLQLWLEKLPGLDMPNEDAVSDSQRQIVVVAMPHERVTVEYDRLAGTSPSIRNERIDLILETLRPFNPVLMEVENYSSSFALDVFQRYPEARAYVCLSDQIAVELKHLLIVTGRDYKHRIVGFDDSQLAKRENITSFGQHLDEIGGLVTAKLSEWFARNLEWPLIWSAFGEIRTDVRLTLRD